MAAALPGKGERDTARAAADLENAGSAGLGWGRRSGILRGSRLLVGTLDGDAVSVEIGLGGFRGFGFCCLRGGFLGLAISKLLGIGAATEHVATQRSLIGSRQVSGTALGGRAFVCQRGLGLARLLDLIVPRQLNTLPGGGLGAQHLGIQIIEDFLDEHLGLGARNEHTGGARDVDHAKLRAARDVLQRLALRATDDRRVHGFELRRVEGLVHAHIQVDTRQARGRAQQPFGRKTGMLLTALGQVLLGPLETTLDGPDLVCHGVLPSYAPGGARMSEQIVREGDARQGTIEGDYRESAQNFCLSPSKVFICRRSYLHPSSFWQGCPKTDQYLTKYLPHRLTRDAPKRAPRLLGRFFEQYFR